MKNYYSKRIGELRGTMPQEPLITTVIPTYRRPKLLRRAIQSVLNQTYPHFQVCVYDNASGDETEAVVAEIMRRDSRVHYHRHAENIGLEHNFAYGAERVTTPFLNFLSDDDLLLPSFFETAMNSFERHPSAAMFVGHLISMTRDATLAAGQIPPWESGLYEPPSGFVRWLRVPFTWTSTLFNRDALASVGGLDTSVGESMDSDIMLKIAGRFPVAAAQVSCAIFFSGGASAGMTLRYWCETQLRTVAAIEADPALDPVARTRMRSALEESLATISFRSGLVSAAQFGRLDDARTAAEIIRRFSSVSSKAQLADLLASDSAAGRTARRALRAVRAVRSRAIRLTRYRRNRQLRAAVQQALSLASNFE
jgi:hypothetical protein